MSVTLTAFSVSAGTSASGISGSTTLNLTLQNVVNGVMLVGITWDANPGAFGNVTWNSANLTQIGSTAHNGAYYNAMFALFNPPSGTGTFDYAWTNTAIALPIGCQFSGVQQTSYATSFINFTSNTGSTSPVTVTNTVTAGSGNSSFYLLAANNTTTGGFATLTSGTQIKGAAGGDITNVLLYNVDLNSTETATWSTFNPGVWVASALDIVAFPYQSRPRGKVIRVAKAMNRL